MQLGLKNPQRIISSVEPLGLANLIDIREKLGYFIPYIGVTIWFDWRWYERSKLWKATDSWAKLTGTKQRLKASNILKNNPPRRLIISIPQKRQRDWGNAIINMGGCQGEEGTLHGPQRRQMTMWLELDKSREWFYGGVKAGITCIGQLF